MYTRLIGKETQPECIHTDLDDSRRRRKGTKAEPAEGVMQEAVQLAEDVVLQLAEDVVRVARYNTMSCSFPRYEWLAVMRAIAFICGSLSVRRVERECAGLCVGCVCRLGADAGRWRVWRWSPSARARTWAAWKCTRSASWCFWSLVRRLIGLAIVVIGAHIAAMRLICWQ